MTIGYPSGEAMRIPIIPVLRKLTCCKELKRAGIHKCPLFLVPVYYKINSKSIVALSTNLYLRHNNLKGGHYF